MKQQGVTLLEVILVVAIIATLSALIGLPFSRFRQTQALQNTTNGVVAILNEARTKTLAAVDNTSYSVKIESGRVTLYPGTTYNEENAQNQVFEFESPVTLSSTSLNGGGTEIRFDRLKGTTSQHGTIVLTLPNSQTQTITVQATGSVMRN